MRARGLAHTHAQQKIVHWLTPIGPAPRIDLCGDEKKLLWAALECSTTAPEEGLLSAGSVQWWLWHLALGHVCGDGNDGLVCNVPASEQKILCYDSMRTLEALF